MVASRPEERVRPPEEPFLAAVAGDLQALAMATPAASDDARARIWSRFQERVTSSRRVLPSLNLTAERTRDN